jgi:hypothetical protein
MLEEQDGAAIEQSGANRRISAIGLTTSVNDTCIDITRDACTTRQTWHRERSRETRNVAVLERRHAMMDLGHGFFFAVIA